MRQFSVASLWNYWHTKSKSRGRG